MDPVPTGLSAYVHHGVANPVRRPLLQVLLVHQPHAHRVDQQVTGIAGIKGRFPRNRRNPHAVAVIPDPLDGILDLHFHRGVIQLAKVQRIQ